MMYAKLDRSKLFCVKTHKKAKKQRKLKFVIIFLIIILFLLGGNILAYGESENTQDVEKTLTDSILEGIENLNVEDLQGYLDELSDGEKSFFAYDDIKDVLKNIINGNFAINYSDFTSAILANIFDGVLNFLPSFAVIIAITILCGIVNQIKSSFVDEGVTKIIFFICYASILTIIISLLMQIVGGCVETVQNLQKQMEIIFPILLTLIATSGGTVSATIYQPSVLFLSEVIVNVITSAIFPFTIVIIALTLASHLSEEIKLKNFCKLYKSINKWLIGIFLTVFSVFISIQGITSATYDGISFKAIKYALSNSVPIVGGFLSSGFDLIMASSVLIKNSVGSVGVLMLVGVIVSPLVALISFSLFLKLVSAITEPIGDSKISSMLSDLSENISYFTAGILVVAFMYFITIMLLICSSNVIF